MQSVWACIILGLIGWRIDSHPTAAVTGLSLICSRAGMSRDFVKELRGDTRGEAIDIYNHIDKKELRESYLAHIPQLGI